MTAVRHTAALCLALGAVLSSQGPEPEPRPVTVRSVSFRGPGCLPGGALESLDGSRTRATIMFSANTAAVGAGVPTSDARKTCEVALSLAVRAGEPASKVLLIFRGEAVLPDGASAELHSDWSWPAEVSAHEQRDVLAAPGGERGGSFAITRELELDTSSAADNRPFVVETQLAMIRGRDAFVTIDSLDVAIGPPPVHAAFGLPDATPPRIEAVPSSEPNAAGWYGGEVLVSFTCEDPESAIVPDLSDLAPKLLRESGGASGTCVNVTGNRTTASYQARIDAQAPRILPAFYPGAGLLALEARVPSGFGCVDAESGVTACGGPGWLDTSTPGLHTISVVARDAAGHATTQTMWYRVGESNDCPGDGWRHFTAPMFASEEECLTALQPPRKGQRP